jgi:hypothetical protein
MVGSMAMEAADTEIFLWLRFAALYNISATVKKFCKCKTNKYVRGFATGKVSFFSLSYYGYVGFWGGWGEVS